MEQRGISLLLTHFHFCLFLCLILFLSFTLSGFILPLHISFSHNHFAPTPISHFPLFSVFSILSHIHSASICLWVSVSISIYVSLFGINLRSLSWSTNFIFLSLPLYLIISLCTRLNSHMRGEEEIAEVDQRGGKERRGRGMKQGMAESTRV